MSAADPPARADAPTPLGERKASAADRARAAGAEREAARQVARAAWRAAVSPGGVPTAELGGLAAHLHALTRDELREMNRALGHQLGGRKDEHVRRLLAHLGVTATAATALPLPPSPPAPADDPPPPATSRLSELEREADAADPLADGLRRSACGPVPPPPRPTVRLATPLRTEAEQRAENARVRAEQAAAAAKRGEHPSAGGSDTAPAVVVTAPQTGPPPSAAACGETVSET